MMRLLIKYLLSGSVFFLFSVFVMDFFTDKVFIYVSGMFGFILAEVMGDIVDIAYDPIQNKDE